MRERDWQQTIVEAAERLGWQPYHTHDSRRSNPGFPDLVLLRPPRLLFIECKTEKGKVSDWQRWWIDTLNAVPGIRALVARPSDWDDVLALLTEVG